MRPRPAINDLFRHEYRSRAAWWTKGCADAYRSCRESALLRPPGYAYGDGWCHALVFFAMEQFLAYDFERDEEFGVCYGLVPSADTTIDHIPSKVSTPSCLTQAILH